MLYEIICDMETTIKRKYGRKGISIILILIVAIFIGLAIGIGAAMLVMLCIA